MVLRALFSLTVAAAGWYYMFYSHAAARLGPYEGMPLNRVRVRLRRLGGFFMFLLAVALFAFFRITPQSGQTISASFFFLLLAIFILLLTIVILALVDLRLTAKLRKILRSQSLRP